MVGDTAAEPKTFPGEGSAEGTGSRLQGHLHFCLVLTKKKKAQKGRGSTQASTA